MNSKAFLPVVALLLVVLVGPLFGPVPAALITAFDIRTATVWQVVLFLIPLGLILAVVLAWMRRQGRTLADVGWRRPTRPAAILLGAALGLAWGALGTASYMQFVPEADVFEVSLFRLFTALVGAGGAVLEDLTTRGFFMEELRRIGAGGWTQALASSLLFAAYHTLWGFNILAFLFSLVYGLMLSGLFVFGRRSLTPVILGHSLALLVGEPFLTLSLMEAVRMAVGG